MQYGTDPLRVFTSPIFWLELVTTALVLAPWLCVRKMPVTCEVFEQAVVVHFSDQRLPPGFFGRVSRTCFGDYHSFAGAQLKPDRHLRA